MLDDDIVWVKLTYVDGSESIFRATKSKEIIEDILGHPEKRDVFDGNVLKEGYLFKVENQVLFELNNVNNSEITESKPQLMRRVDRFANSFI